jgi:hypothetical protein
MLQASVELEPKHDCFLVFNTSREIVEKTLEASLFNQADALAHEGLVFFHPTYATVFSATNGLSLTDAFMLLTTLSRSSVDSFDDCPFDKHFEQKSSGTPTGNPNFASINLHPLWMRNSH